MSLKNKWHKTFVCVKLHFIKNVNNFKCFKRIRSSTQTLHCKTLFHIGSPGIQTKCCITNKMTCVDIYWEIAIYHFCRTSNISLHQKYDWNEGLFDHLFFCFHCNYFGVKIVLKVMMLFLLLPMEQCNIIWNPNKKQAVNIT